MSHCNPAYFKYAEALVKSIRHAGNENHIVLKLQDFSKQEKDQSRDRLKNLNNIDLDFIDTNEEKYGISPLKFINEVESRKSQLYTDCMPFLMHEMLKDYKDDVFKISANGLVFTDLSEVEDVLKEEDFLFHEREPRMNSTFTGVKKIEDVLVLAEHRNFEKWLDNSLRQVRQHAQKEVNSLSEVAHMRDYLKLKGGKLSLQEIVHLPICRPVLLGTLGVSNNPMTRLFVKTWKDYILEERESGELFYTSFKNEVRTEVYRKANIPEKRWPPAAERDTREDDSFVRTYIDFIKSGKKLTRKTGLWDGNTTDSSCTSDKIWFAKGSTKTGGGKNNKGKRYLEKLEFFRSLYN